MRQLTAAGGVLFRERGEGPEAEVLLIFRRGVWDLPKGKIEPGERIEECALREVSEEVGSSLPKLHTRLKDTYHEYREDGELTGKTTHWFAMSLSNYADDLEPEKEEGIEELEWMPLSKARSAVGYDNLIEVLHAFDEWYSLQDKKGAT